MCIKMQDTLSEPTEQVSSISVHITHSKIYLLFYEGGLCDSYNTYICLQSLDVQQAYNSHLKAEDVPFQMIYGGLIYSKGLQNDRPK